MLIEDKLTILADAVQFMYSGPERPAVECLTDPRLVVRLSLDIGKVREATREPAPPSANPHRLFEHRRHPAAVERQLAPTAAKGGPAAIAVLEMLQPADTGPRSRCDSPSSVRLANLPLPSTWPWTTGSAVLRPFRGPLSGYLSCHPASGGKRARWTVEGSWGP